MLLRFMNSWKSFVKAFGDLARDAEGLVSIFQCLLEALERSLRARVSLPRDLQRLVSVRDRSAGDVERSADAMTGA